MLKRLDLHVQQTQWKEQLSIFKLATPFQTTIMLQQQDTTARRQRNVAFIFIGQS